MMGIKNSRTTPYRASGNGMTERFKRTLISMIGTIDTEKKETGNSLFHLFVYNCIHHKSTGYSPYSLLFGREPRLPVDVAFGIEPESVNEKSYNEYVSDLREKIGDAFEKVQNIIMQISQEKNRKKNYDLKAEAARLLEGDRVLVKVLAHEGKHELGDKWTEDIYVVVRQPNNDISVYRAKRADGQGQEKTLHRNNLFHLGSSLLDESQNTNDFVSESRDKSDDAQKASVPKPRKQTKDRVKQRNDKEKLGLHNVSDKVSDSEEDMVIIDIAKKNS